VVIRGFINSYILVAKLGAELWAESVAAAEQNADDVFRRATGAHELFS
jgi:hypothetical protein